MIPAFVLLEDGNWFAGTTARPIDPAFGEVVFTTNLTGYQETFTDPSYLGQIVVMTAPMIGNYGVNPEDSESDHPQVTGVVVRELSRHASNWRSTQSLDEWLGAAGVPVLEGIDTRRLTRHLRERGAMRGVVAQGREPTKELTAQLLASPTMDGLDLASRATVGQRHSEGAGPHVVAYDFGMKRNIVRMLVQAGCRVTVVPSTTSVAAVRDLKPDGLFLSNGPGDPAAVGYALDTIRQLSGSGLPTFGICLGHQLVGLAYGGTTAKLPYGHRGGNHPVQDVRTDQVLITTQNHGFAVVGGAEGVPGAPALQVTHLNLNDGTIEGIRHRELPLFAVQYHPEAAPGPHDALPHFAEFMASLGAGRASKPQALDSQGLSS
ncbi:MAG: glutamine-hydrolyzing carbamoyl-phosphate synthase small subunit [Gemmatimonadota bacterium]|nr:glutamine-hydrolyzing carbamoyl-phosphate synthase small subunit [Gemmatimonadales bacterium]MDQ3209192.1 glutamine-hydrolyzing carbamoyl-phosphate synthase small subunit [Gemmatimonadota bacterium]